MESIVVRLAAKRLFGRSLQLRRKYAGLLLDSVKHIKSLGFKGHTCAEEGGPGTEANRPGEGFVVLARTTQIVLVATWGLLCRKVFILLLT